MIDPERLQEFVENSGLSYRQNRVSWIFGCPRCGKHEKAYLRKADGRFICWHCAEIDGYKGRPEFLLADLLQQPIKLVREALYGALVVDSTAPLALNLGGDFGQEDEGVQVAVIPTQQWPWNFYPIENRQFSARGQDYLESRGVPLDIAVEYGIRYCPQEQRIAFPVEIDGRLVGWQKRLVIDARHWSEERGKYIEAPKMLSSIGIPTAHVAMFGDRIKGHRHVVICEGPIDAIRCHMVGGNVATMGKAVSRGQIAFLRNQGVERVYLGLDPDAVRETSRLVREFSDLEVFLLQPPAGVKDLGEMTFDGVRDAFVNAPQVGPGRIFIHLQ